MSEGLRAAQEGLTAIFADGSSFYCYRGRSGLIGLIDLIGLIGLIGLIIAAGNNG